MVITRA